MRKNNKKIKVLLLASCVLVSTVMAGGSISKAEDKNAKMLQDMGNAYEKQMMEEQKKNAQEDIMQADAKDAYGELLHVVDDSAAVEQKYAGAYIDDNNILVVNLTTSSERIKDIVQENTEAQEVKFKKQAFTYDELMESYRKIGNTIRNTKYADVVSSFYVDEINNAIVVDISDLSYIDGFKQEVCDDECIEFNKADKKIAATTTNLKPGGYIDNSTYCYSIGWRGWRINNAGNYTEGLVTAAHGNKLKDIAYTYGGHVFGKFVLRRYGGSLDAAFVQRTSDKFDVSNTIKFSGSSLKAGYYVRSSSMCVGTKVYKVGMKTGLTTGKIVSANCTVTIKDGDNYNTFTNYVRANYNSDSGDSGGLVYMDVNGAYRILGNHVAGAKGAADSYSVKAENIIENVNIYPY